MKKLISLFAILFQLTIACNKSGNNSSPNGINYTLGSNSVTICPDSANVGQMIGGPTCRLYMSRQNRYLNGQPSSIAITLDSNCDFISGPIPYSTTHFICVIIDHGNSAGYVPETGWTYPDGNPFDRSNIPKGNLTLQVTYRRGGHIKGTVVGNIFGGSAGTVPDTLAKLTCDFDVILTVR